VICTDLKAAAWAAEPIITELPGYTLTPQVFGPDQIPVVTDSAQVAAHPELATLSVMVHGARRPVAEAFMAGLARLEEPRSDHALKYYEHAYRLSSKSVQRILEELLMTSTDWPVYSPFAKEHYGKGMKDGEAKGEAKAVLTVLQARGIPVSEVARVRITACTDLAQLDEWVRLAATATCADELFADQA
jgi:hypothetical protein